MSARLFATTLAVLLTSACGKSDPIKLVELAKQGDVAAFQREVDRGFDAAMWNTSAAPSRSHLCTRQRKADQRGSFSRCWTGVSTRSCTRKDGMTPLLVRSGANVKQSAGVMTPINGAVQSGKENLVRFLLSAGAEPGFGDAQMAEQSGHPKMATLLRLEKELAVFLVNANQSGVLDKERLAQYQTRLEDLQRRMQILLNGSR
jgi:hypothetical protein